MKHYDYDYDSYAKKLTDLLDAHQDWHVISITYNADSRQYVVFYYTEDEKISI